MCGERFNARKDLSSALGKTDDLLHILSLSRTCVGKNLSPTVSHPFRRMNVKFAKSFAKCLINLSSFPLCLFSRFSVWSPSIPFLPATSILYVIMTSLLSFKRLQNLQVVDIVFYVI